VKSVSIPLGTIISRRFFNWTLDPKEVSIPLGTIIRILENFTPEELDLVSIPLGTIISSTLSEFTDWWNKFQFH